MTGMDVFSPFLVGLVKPIAVLVVLALVVNMLRDALRTHADPSDS